MTVVDLSKPACPAFFKVRTIKKKKSAAERREGMSAAYLDLIRSLPCCIPSCRRPPRSESHHLRCTGERGTALKSTDRWCVPLCATHHNAGGPECTHYVGTGREVDWFWNHQIDCLALASSLWMNRDSIERMAKVLFKHWEKS